MDGNRKKKTDYIILFSLPLLILGLYWQTREFVFVNIDDYAFIIHNPVLKQGWHLATVLWSFSFETAKAFGLYQPLVWLSHLAEISLFGLDAGMFHLNNVVLHIFNSLLLFLFFRVATGKPLESGIVAGLFAVHPVHVESVAWIIERKDVLSTFFFLGGLLSYYFYTEKKNLSAYLLVCIFLLLAMMSKTSVITFPFALLLLDFWPLKRKEKIVNLFREKIPLFFIILIMGYISFISAKSGGTFFLSKAIPLVFRLKNAVIAYVKYLGKLVYPHDLTFFYPYPDKINNLYVIGALFLLLSITGIVLYVRKSHPYFLTGWFWFCGTLVPMIGIVQAGTQQMADRFLYIPAMGFYAGIVFGIFGILPGLRAKKTAAALFAGIILLLLPITYKQIGYWENTLTLTRHAFRVNDSHMARFIVVQPLIIRGECEKAIHHMEKLKNMLDKRKPYISQYYDYDKMIEYNMEYCRKKLKKKKENGRVGNLSSRFPLPTKMNFYSCQSMGGSTASSSVLDARAPGLSTI